MSQIDYKTKTIFEFTDKFYHDLSDIQQVFDPEKTQELANNIIELINNSGLPVADSIKCLKSVTLTAILESASQAVEDIEKKQIEKFKEDLK